MGVVSEDMRLIGGRGEGQTEAHDWLWPPPTRCPCRGKDSPVAPNLK